jgi:hypothetical protein
MSEFINVCLPAKVIFSRLAFRAADKRFWFFSGKEQTALAL